MRRAPACSTCRRQLGGSFGIAITATLLTRFPEQSREALLPHVSPANPAAIGWLEQATTRLLSVGGSLGAARQQAHALLEATLRQQASMVAFEKVFLTMGVTFAAALPLLLLFRTGRVRGGAGAHWTGGTEGRRTERRTEGRKQEPWVNVVIPSCILFPLPLPFSVFPFPLVPFRPVPPSLFPFPPLIFPS